MKHTTWTPERARMFARGLYHVAACDGVAPREADAIRRFLAATGLEPDLDALGADPFDYAEAAEVLDSPWLRRVFIHACRVMVHVDGVVSAAERDVMRAIAAGLGVGERVALENLDAAPQPQPDLAEWIARRAVDRVDWDDTSQPGFFWTFPHPSHPLAEGAALAVARGQIAVVHVEGEIADVLQPGEHLVRPDSLPGLSRATGWHEGPVRGDITFVSTLPSKAWRWGTADAIVIRDPDFGAVPLRAYGRFSIRIGDVERAFGRFARQGSTTLADFQTRVRRIVAGRAGEGLIRVVEGDPTALPVLFADLDGLSRLVRPHLEIRLADAGLILRRFDIENITAPVEYPHGPSATRSLRLGRPPTQMELAPTPLVDDLSPTDHLAPCPGCLNPVPTAARFCAKCGASQRRPCLKCGAEIAARARFCSECGTGQQEDLPSPA